MTDDRPFWFDWDYDRNNADLGTTSRYGNYLNARTAAFAEIWYDDPSVEFAALAWRIATGPVLAPPLVHSHPRIAGATVHRSGWNGEMVADLTLVSPRPKALANAKDTAGRWYRDRPTDSWGEYEGIGEQDLTCAPYMVTTVQMLWQLPAGLLPKIAEVSPAGDALHRQALECLGVIVGALNREVGPIIDLIERD